MPENNEKPPNKVVEGLLKKRILVLDDKITHNSSRELAGQLIALQLESSEPINLFIDSPGGGLEPALFLCDLISKVITAPVRGIALGRCFSAATFIMLYCDERIGTPHSRFLIHSGTRNEISIPINETTSENLEHLLKDAKGSEERVTRLYVEKLTPARWARVPLKDRRRRTFVQSLLRRGDQRFDQSISAEEAIEIGLIEKIAEREFDIFVS